MRWLAALALGISAVTAVTALGQDVYPSRGAKIVVPFPPGGLNDVVARVLAQRLAERWSQPFVVENRPGGGTIIGSEAVAKAAPDGYTLLLASVAHAINPSIYKRLPYDPLKSFAPILLVCASPFVLGVRPGLPVTTLAELVALAKSQPGRLTYSSTGGGGSSHLMAEMLRSMAGLELIHVPYKGMAPAVADVVGGQVDFTFGSYASTRQFLGNGRLRPIAVSSAKRLAVLPELPTIAEQGFPGYDANPWWGLVAPAGTPDEIIAKLHAESVRIVRAPEVTRQWQDQGLEIIASTSAEFARHMAIEVDRWAKIVRDSGARIE